MQIAVIVPTYNAKRTIESLINTIQAQTLKPNNILIVDSSSSDTTIAIAKTHNLTCHIIQKSTFNHGTTRKYATSLVDADIYIFLTQDVRLADENAFKHIIDAFADKSIGCAYGRQLPNEDASILAAHPRLFVYPPTSMVMSYQDRHKFGIKTCFNSDNFAAYRKTALLDIDGIPENVIVSEDMYAAAKMLMHDWRIAYCADAMIYHSHDYTLTEEFNRYADIGAFHAANPWIFKNFPGHISDSIEYLNSAILYCIKNHAYLTIPKIIVNILAQWSGFLIGRYFRKFWYRKL